MAARLGEDVFAAIVDGTTSYPFTDWRVLAELAAATTGAARDELLAATIAAGSDQIIDCFAKIAPLLAAETSRAFALAELRDARDHNARGLLLGTLPEADVDAVLPPLLEEVVAIAEASARRGAMWDLVRSLPVARRDRAITWFDVEVERRYGFELGRAYYRSEDERTDEEVARIIAYEREMWGAPFTAWRLGRRALGLPSPQCEAMLDRAIDEFAAIADTPVDPGNDEGPFWEIASALDERQIRRALAIVDRMDAPRWCYQLAGSRSQLAIRLARLGYWREATAQLDLMMTNDPFAAKWRAETAGGIIGARLALEPDVSASELLAEASGDSTWQWGVLVGLLDVFRDRLPRTDHVEACLSYALGIADDRLRILALESIAAAWITALPAERWLAIGVAPLVLVEAIHDAGGDPTAMLALVPRDASTFGELCRYRTYLAPESCLPAWTAWLRSPTATRDFDLAAVLVWLGGEDALLGVGRAFIRATTERTRAACGTSERPWPGTR